MSPQEHVLQNIVAMVRADAQEERRRTLATGMFDLFCNQHDVVEMHKDTTLPALLLERLTQIFEGAAAAHLARIRPLTVTA